MKQTHQFSPVQHALSDGLHDAGCQYAMNVPGARSQELFTLLGGTQIALNERIAFEACYGASLAGKRSVLTMKNVGLSASLDPYVHAVLNGIHAGFVIVLYDDVEVTSSPERQDSRPLNDLFPSIWLEPNSVKNAYAMAAIAPTLSEESNMPVVIRITNQLHRLDGTYSRETQEKPSLGIANKRHEFISYWTERTARYEKNLEIATKKVSALFTKKPTTTHSIGVVMVGTCWEELEASSYAKENVDILEVQTYPLDAEVILPFVQAHDEVVVFEQGLPYVQQKIAAMLGNTTVSLSSNTGFVPDLADKWMTFNFTEKMFKGLQQVRPEYVVGDEGQFTDETTKTIQSCLCMGASVGIGIGLAAAGVHYPFAVTGDVSFLHGGMQSLREALVQKAAFGVILIDNGGAGSTGGQPRGASVTDIPAGIPIITKIYEETSTEEFAELFASLQKENKLTVVHVILGKK